MNAPDQNSKTQKTKSPLKSESIAAKDKLQCHLKAEFDEIVGMARTFRLEGQHGPTLRVKTKIEWSDHEGRALYLAVREHLHDRKRDNGYFYVTKLKPELKSGFRIAVHTQPTSRGRGETLGVLCINN